MPSEPQKYDVTAFQKRITEARKEIAAIRTRASEQYRHEPGEQYTPMLRDLCVVLGELNVVNELWESAEKELDEIRDCDKCDLCEDDHHE